MHILFLTDNFPPEVNAPASRTFEHCREWVKAGHRVTVITCAPNFPTGRVFPPYRNRLWQAEIMDGIRVIRVWTYITANEGFFRRTLDYASFMLAALPASFFVHAVDVVVGTSPQIFTACAAYSVGRLKGVPFIFELRDLWPEQIKAVGVIRNSVVLRHLERLELFLYRKAARVVVLTRAFRDNLIKRGIEADKIDVVTNGVDLGRFTPRARDTSLAARLGLSGKFVAGYIGTHGLSQRLETVLYAAQKLARNPLGQSIFFLFVGDGAEKAALRKKADDLGLSNVVFLDTVAKEDVPRYWALLDVSIIHLRQAELFKSVIPSKLFECMAMGVPVVHGVQGESAALVELEGIGLTFAPEDVEELCERLKRLYADRGLRSTLSSRCVASAAKYERGALARRMLAVLQTVGVPAVSCEPTTVGNGKKDGLGACGGTGS